MSQVGEQEVVEQVRHAIPFASSSGDQGPTVPAAPSHAGYPDTRRRVSQGKDPSALNRMGPYPDRATAERALEIAAERNKAADEADEEWNR
ncbi:MAG: hypothetical protein DCC47_09070 [Acidobacteria bacterium]|nr:MAG: hypothetical protein DCC47_09070 [Acidobacteriota bacterium]